MEIGHRLTRRVGAGALICFSVVFFGSAVEAAPPYGSAGAFHSWRDDDPSNLLRLPRCVDLTNYQVRQRVGAHGYVNIYLGGDIGRSGNVEVKGTLKGKVYLLEVDKCTGKIEAATPLGG